MSERNPGVRYATSFVLLFLAALLTACGSNPAPTAANTVRVTADTVPVQSGLTTQLHAIDTSFQKQVTDVTYSAVWASSNPGVATVSAAGVLTAISPGMANITAFANAVTGTLTLQVAAPGVTGLTLTPQNALVASKGTQRYLAIAKYTDNTTGNASSSVHWSVSPATVASIDGNGLLTAVSAGNFTVVAAVESYLATANGTVLASTLSSMAITPGNATLASGSTQQFTATGSNTDGSTTDLSKSATWSSSNTALLTVDANGLATAVGGSAGSVTVTAQSGSFMASVPVAITSTATITGFFVKPTSSSIATGSAEQHSALALYSDGTQKDVTSSSVWSVVVSPAAMARSQTQAAAATGGGSDSVVNVNQAGVDQAVSPGTSLLQASFGGVQSQSVVIVTPATVTSLAIRASKDLFPVGSTQPLQLIGIFSDGTTQDLSLSANWVSADPSIATIDATGLATGVRSGGIQFSASFGGLTASTVGFQVLPVGLISTVIDLPFPVEFDGLSQQLRLLGTYSNGTTHDLTELATWAVGDPNVFRVDSTGLGYALHPGTTQITGSVFGMSTISTVATLESTLVGIRVLPNTTSIALGTTFAFTAYASFSDGVDVDVTPEAIWTSSDPEVLTIDAQGRAKAGKVGTAAVGASLLGVTQYSSTIQVTNPTLTTLVIYPYRSQVGTYTPQQFIAYGRFSDGSAQNLSHDVIWNTSDNTIASVDMTGLVIGMRPGKVQVTGTFGGVVASAPLTVTSATLVSVAITPASPELPVGFNLQFKLLGTFSDGSTEDLTQVAIWSAPTPLIAGIALKGFGVGGSPGISSIEAKYGFFSASTPVTVTSATLSSLAIAPLSSVIREGGVVGLTTTGTFSDGLVQDVTALNAVFSSDTPSVAGILETTVAYGRGVGSATITGTVKGLSASTTTFQVLTGAVTSIAVTPTQPVLNAGLTMQFTATATYEDGSTGNVTSSTTWSISNAAVVYVDENGLATGIAPGTATVTATSSGRSQTFTVTVDPAGTAATLTRLAVTPATSNIVAGASIQLTALGSYSDGTERNLTSTATWTASNPAVATVSTTGLTTGAGAGTVTIQAQLGSQLSSATLNVSAPASPPPMLASISVTPANSQIPAGTTVQMIATGSYSDGSTADLTNSVVWSSLNSGTVNISSAGLSTGIAAGLASVQAQLGSVSNTVIVRVSAASLSALAITPGTASLAAGDTQQFTLTGTFSDGSTQNLTPSATWTTSAAGIGTITSEGLATGVAVGTVQFTGSFGGQSTSTTAQITSATLSAITVVPTSSHIADGTTVQLAAIGTYSDGSKEDLTTVATWSTSDFSEATVDTSGLATGIGIGLVSVQAQVGSMANAADVKVSAATLTSVAVSPGGPSFAAGATQQFVLTGTFTDGSHQDLTSAATWSSSATGVAGISATGLATGLTPGSAQIAGSYNGESATTTVQITAATLVSVAITPASPSFADGTSQQFIITGTYTDGTTHDLTSQATFSSSNEGVVSVSASGLGTGTGVGSAQVSVAVEGEMATTRSVTVSAATLASIAVTPNTVSFANGTMQQFTATGIFSDSSTQNLSMQAVWQSSNAQVVTIDVNGLASGVGTGLAQIVATLNGVSGSASATSTAATLASVALSPRTAQIAKGTSLQFTATGLYTDGTTQSLSSSVAWASSNSSVVSIDANGLATGTGVGSATLTATIQGHTVSTSSFMVTPATLVSVSFAPASPSVSAGSSAQVTVTGAFSDGSTQDLSSTAAYNSANPGAVTVSQTGVLSGVAPGTSTITVNVDGMTSSFTATVTNATLVSIAIAPTHPPSFAKGSTEQFTAIGTYSDGSTQNLSPLVTWTSINPAVFTVDMNGLATGTGLGTATLSAGYQGQTAATPNFQVTPAAVASVAVTPVNASIVSGATQQFSATATYTDGSTQDLSGSASWTSSTGAASVSGTGLAMGLATGSASIAATVDGVSSSTTLSVAAAPVAPVTLSGLAIGPTSSHAAAGTTAQFHATATYSDGSTADVSNSVSWTSSTASEATVSSSGLASALAAGTPTIQAVSGAYSGSATLVVTAATLTSVAISPSGASFASGSAQQFTLTGTFSDGSTQNLSASAAWTSSAPGVATIASTGLANGVAPGSMQFTASYNGITASTGTVTVTPATLVSLAITPATSSFANGTSQQFTVTGTYSDNSSQDLTGASTFSSSSPAVVSVSAAGVATGMSSGTSEITASVNGQSATTQSVTVTPSTLVSIVITPNSPSFARGTTQQFVAIGTFSDGTTQNLNSQTVWSSSNPQVLTIGSNGLASSNDTGSAQVTATLSGLSTTTGNATVTPATLASLTLSPMSAQVARGTTQQFIATGAYTDGSTQNLSTDVAWSSSNGAVVSIDANGLATGTGVGSASLTATYQGQTVTTANFSVTPATLVSIAFNPASPSVASGTSAQVTVTGTFSDGSTQDLSSSATYSSSNPAAVTVGSTGILRGNAPGTSTVTASVDGMTSSFTATVTNATLSSIAITPTNPSSFAKGTTEQFTATGSYSDGSTQNLSTMVTWISSNTGVFTIDGNGLATGAGIGTASLSADDQGESASAVSVQVTLAVPASLAITPVNPTIATSSTQQFTATATYTDGSTQNLTSSASWMSSTPAVASIDSAGLASGVATGSSTISASVAGLNSSTAVTVTSAPVAPVTLTALAVTPANASLTAGSGLQYTATATYSDGSMQNVSSSVTWNSSATGIATINASGLASGIAAGNISIAAQLSGSSSSTNLTVTAAPVTLVSIAVTPSSPSIAKGSSQQFVATGSYSDGSTQNLSTQVTWQSSVPSVATVSTIGLASGVAAGSTQIWASFAGHNSDATLTVGPATLASLAVTPQTASVAAGTAQQYKAVGTMTDGGTQDLTSSVTWTSSSNGIATINAVGLASTSSPGSATITAQSGAVGNTAALTVTSATVASIQLTPSPVSLPVGDTQQMLATATFSDGSSQDVTSSVAYTTSNPRVANIDASGQLTAVGSGSATVTAALGSHSSMIDVTISSATLNSIAVTPADPSLAVGLSRQLTATGTFSDGSTADLTHAVSWASSAAMTVSVNTTGDVSVAATGTAVITATSGSVSGNVTVTGTSAVVTAIAVSPASATLASGQTQQFAATATFSDNSQQDVTASAHWSVSVPAKATVSNTAPNSGFVTTNASGSTNVTAALNGISGSATLTIQAASLSSLTIAPASLSLPAGTSQSLSVTGTYTDGSTANLTASATFRSVSSSIAAVSASGRVSGVSAGSTSLTATVTGVSASAPVTVTGALLSSIAIGLPTPSVALGLHVQLTATGTYTDGSTTDITSQVRWTSSAASIATVGSSGLVSTLGVGSSTLSATLNGIGQTAALTVNAASLQSIALTAAQSSFALGLSLQLKAEGTFSDGTMQDLTATATWSSQTAAIGVVSASGLATGHATGTFTAQATIGSVNGTLSVTVTSALLVSITVTPANTTVVDVLGNRIQFTATGLFTDGSSQIITTSVHWAIATGLGIATISSTGALSPVAVGSGTVTATSGSISGATSFRVVAI